MRAALEADDPRREARAKAREWRVAQVVQRLREGGAATTAELKDDLSARLGSPEQVAAAIQLALNHGKIEVDSGTARPRYGRRFRLAGSS